MQMKDLSRLAKTETCMWSYFWEKPECPKKKASCQTWCPPTISETGNRTRAASVIGHSFKLSIGRTFNQKSKAPNV